MAHGAWKSVTMRGATGPGRPAWVPSSGGGRKTGRGLTGGRRPATGEPEGEDRGVARRDVFPPARMWGWFVLFFFFIYFFLMGCV